jgi:hypothetical protein
MKNHGYSVNYEMVLNLAHIILAGRGLKAFLSGERAQDVKNKTRNAKEQTEYTLYQVYDCDFFELTIHAFDIQSGWWDAFERQREYTRRYIFIGKLNPENFSQRLQYLNKYLDYTPIEKTTGADKTQNEYGKSLPDDKIGSIIGWAIPPELTVNMLALGKEPWSFKDLDELNMYRQQWQADQQKQIIANMAGKMQIKSNDG